MICVVVNTSRQEVKLKLAWFEARETSDVSISDTTSPPGFIRKYTAEEHYYPILLYQYMPHLMHLDDQCSVYMSLAVHRSTIPTANSQKTRS